MSKLIICGGTVLSGKVDIGGAKNSVLPILACTLLSKTPVVLRNCPRISDVYNMLDILERLGCRYEFSNDYLYIDTSTANTYTMPETLSKELRSSIFMLGPILARFKKACCVYPGGCEIGNRPIDLHIRGLSMLNVAITEENGKIYCNGENMQESLVHLDYPSVGATENIMMAATGICATTVIENAAREPEIEDLQAFLRTIGMNVSGAGTSKIVIDGSDRMKQNGPITHDIIPDRIVAGTVLCAGAITGGHVEVCNVVPGHMQAVTAKLREMGCTVVCNENSISLSAPKRLSEIKHLETYPHPGFPTDMQAILFALCTVANGTSVIVENIFENRFKHAPELIKMGAAVTQCDRTAVIRGVAKLSGTEVEASDLRCGAALTIAGLAAQGKTTVTGAEYIERGYEHIEHMLNSLGARVVFSET